MKILLTSVLALAAIGCATPYQPVGYRGGYSELHIKRDTFEVVFEGNALVTKQSVNAMALLRAAYLCDREGFAFMTVLRDDPTMKRTVRVSPESTTIRSYALKTGTNNRTPTATTRIVRTPESRRVSEMHRASITVKCTETDPGTARTYEVRFYLESVGRRFSMKGN